LTPPGTPPQRPSAGQPLRPFFSKGAPAGHGCGGAPQNRPITASASPRTPSLSSETRRPAPLTGLHEPQPDLLRLDLRMVVCWLAACSLSIWLACGAPMVLGSRYSRSIWFACGGVVFLLARGALFGFGLPTALPSLDRGALFRFGSSLRVFSWRAALSFLSVVSLWLVACVCVFAPSLARALAYSARALFPLQRGCPCFEAKRARMS
jgi:hypothetical protein